MIGDEDLADIRKKLWEAGSDTRLRHPKPGATQLFVSPRRYRCTTNSCAEAHPWAHVLIREDVGDFIVQSPKGQAAGDLRALTPDSLLKHLAELLNY